MQGMASEVQSMGADAMRRCARHVAAVRGKAAAVRTKAAAAPSIAAEGMLRGSMAVEGMPRCKASWLPRRCRGAQQGCEGPPRRAAWLPRGEAAWLPRGCRVDAEGMPMCETWLP